MFIKGQYCQYLVNFENRSECILSNMLMENFMNEHFKSELKKIALRFFLSKANIWKFSTIMLTHFSPGFLITVI